MMMWANCEDEKRFWGVGRQDSKQTTASTILMNATGSFLFKASQAKKVERAQPSKVILFKSRSNQSVAIEMPDSTVQVCVSDRKLNNLR
jgi:glycerol-3-phosphate dehydrogenase